MEIDMKNTIITLSIFVALVIALPSHAQTENLLADRHISNGFGCQDCHASETSIQPQNTSCINCHGDIKEMAKLTNKPDTSGGLYQGNVNPHEHHLGPVDCYECHTMHSQTKNNPCVECHSIFTLKMP